MAINGSRLLNISKLALLCLTAACASAEEPQHLCTIPGLLDCAKLTAAECNKVQTESIAACAQFLADESQIQIQNEEERQQVYVSCVLGSIALSSSVDHETITQCLNEQ